MGQKTLSKWLKVIIIGAGVCLAVVYAVVVPTLGQSIVAMAPEMEGRYLPWLILILLTGLPCYGALFCCWRISTNIGADRSFSEENAVLLKKISVLAAGDAAFFYAGNVVFLLLDMSHAAVLIISLVVSFIGAAVAVAAAALSHLVRKAAVLQEESDLTI